MRKFRTFCRTPRQLFLLLCLLNTALFLVLLPVLGQRGFAWAVMENNSDFAAADYFLCIQYALGGKNVYQFGPDACYSPLAYLVFWLLGRMTSVADFFQGVDVLQLSYPEMIRNTMPLLASPYQLVGYLGYLLGGVLLYGYAVSQLDLPEKTRRALTVCVLFSVPLLFGALERGNLTLYVAALVLVAWKWRDAESPILRELALVLIAVAAGLKFYPAFLGLLYLQEKRWKEAGRLIVYGAVCVFVPFTGFGGVQGLRQLLGNLSQLSFEEYGHRVQFFKGVLVFLHIRGRAADVLNLAFLLVLAALLFWTKSRVRRMTYLAAMLAFYPPNGYRYMLLFFLLPLFAWLEEASQQGGAVRYAEGVLFAAMFSIPTLWGILTGFRQGLGPYTLSYVELFIYLAAWLLLALEVLQEGQMLLRKRKDDAALQKGGNDRAKTA